MSFGNLSKILEKTSGIINLTYNKKDSLSLGCISQMKMNVIKELQGEFPDITMNIIDEVFNRLFSTNYMFNKTVCFDNGKNCFREFEENYPDFMVPEKYKELDKHFNKLKLLPQPAQRSKEWFDYRYNRITASDTAAAIDMNPYEPVEGFILKKCDPNFPFRDNATVFHGKKYEPVATMIYEHIYNTRVFEFGALPSEKYNFLGASPDGISSKYTLDNKFSERLGIMLEIKCPVTRDIHTEGTIAGDICPFYYYCQVQQQLACCTLDICDFWQCKLLEFKTRHEYLADTCNGNTSEGITDPKFPNMSNPVKIDIDKRLKKGIILEFYPKNFVPEFDGDMAEWKSKYIMPKRLDMNEEQYDNWVVNMMDNYKTLYPDINEKYYFHRIIYWGLEQSHNISIKYDDVFMTSIIPILKDTWAKVVYYRKNKDKLDELKKVVDERKKYIKINTSYKISNIELIKNKILFLQEKEVKTPEKTEKTEKTKKVKYDSDNDTNNKCNFIDDDEPTSLGKNKVLSDDEPTEKQSLSVAKKEEVKKPKKPKTQTKECESDLEEFTNTTVNKIKHTEFVVEKPKKTKKNKD
jgi:putative phage-type endonuclease